MGLGVSPNTLEEAESREEAPSPPAAPRLPGDGSRWQRPKREAGDRGRADAWTGGEVGLRGRAWVVYSSRSGRSALSVVDTHRLGIRARAGGPTPPTLGAGRLARGLPVECPEEATPAAGQ